MSDEETKEEGTCACSSGENAKDCCKKEVKEEGCKCEGEDCKCEPKEE